MPNEIKQENKSKDLLENEKILEIIRGSGISLYHLARLGIYLLPLTVPEKKHLALTTVYSFNAIDNNIYTKI